MIKMKVLKGAGVSADTVRLIIENNKEILFDTREERKSKISLS